MATQSSASAIAVLGGSGEVGGAVVKALLGLPQCSKILLLNRRHLEAYENESKVEEHIVDTEKLEVEAAPILRGGDVKACIVTLAAGQPELISEDELRHTDIEIPTSFAKAAKAAGCVRHWCQLSVNMANPDAKPSRLTGTAPGGGIHVSVKGEVEKRMSEMGFQSVSLIRPSAIVGNKHTPKAIEIGTRIISRVLPSRFHEIHKERLGRAMANAAFRGLEPSVPAVQVYEGKSLFDLAPEGESSSK